LHDKTQSLRVLIAENHRDLSDIMRQLFDSEADMCCVGQVAEAGDVLAMARRTEADVVILDLMLQGGSGLPLIAELSAALPSLRIIVFSGIAFSEDVAREATRRGAAAFVTKGADFEVLLHAVRQGGLPPEARSA
jgi:two-component system, response regulator, stage 0 sporulation protein A